MNEKLQYASMLDIPVSTCNITYKPIKKKRTKRKKEVAPEEVKQELMDKVNSEVVTQEVGEQAVLDEQPSEQEDNSVNIEIKSKKKFAFSTVGIQSFVVLALIAVIAITNMLNTNSGINVFMRSLFSSQPTQTVDQREFTEFLPVISMGAGEEYIVEGGVVTSVGEGSVYSPCNGTVSEIMVGEDGAYTVIISHSENFKTRIEGLNFVYNQVGDTVYSNVPVGYVDESQASLCFLGLDGAIITGYEVIDKAVVWAV